MTPNARMLADVLKAINKGERNEQLDLTGNVTLKLGPNPVAMKLFGRKMNQWVQANHPHSDPNATENPWQNKQRLKLLNWLIFELAIKPEALVLDALYDVDPLGEKDGITSSKRRPFAICTQVHALLDSMPERKKWGTCEELVQRQYACGTAQYLLESAINSWPALNGHPVRFPVEGSNTEFFNTFDRGELWKNPRRHELWHHMIARMEEII